MTKLIMTVIVDDNTQKVKIDLRIDKHITSDEKEIQLCEFVEGELRKVIGSATEKNEHK